MLSHLRSNIVAYLALFVALSGTAVAAVSLPKNSIGTQQLKRNAVTGKDVRANTLTGRHIRESRLGRVPSAASAANAAALGGQPASAFLAAGGKAADADRLDGIDSSVFGSAITAAGMSFEPRNTTGGPTKSYQGTGAISCAGGAEDFTLRVQLPQGATVTGLDYRYIDNNGGANSGLELRAYSSMGEGTAVTIPIASAASDNTTSPSERTATAAAATPHVVDNSRYSYQLNWSPFACAATMQLVGGRIRYTLP